MHNPKPTTSSKSDFFGCSESLKSYSSLSGRSGGGGSGSYLGLTYGCYGGDKSLYLDAKKEEAS